MTENTNFYVGPTLQLVVLLCVQFLTNQQNAYKNGSACTFTFKVISWKLRDENHFGFLLMIGKNKVAIKWKKGS